MIAENGVIAQLVERYNGIVEVSGSIPLDSTKSQKHAMNSTDIRLESKGFKPFLLPYPRLSTPCNRWYIVGIFVGMK